MNLIPVILSGGTGTRLWPLSLPHEPKQFLNLGVSSDDQASRSLIQETVCRLDRLTRQIEGIKVSEPLVVCNEAHRFLVSEHMRAIHHKPLSIILEPAGRNTAPAVAIAALKAMETDPDALLLIMPSDHLIQNQTAFYEAIEKALSPAQSGDLMTFGIVPDSPRTGYGYIQKGQPLGENGVYQIKQFVEKPDREKAEDYLASGDYFWNSGIFLFRADVFLRELKTYNEPMLLACQQAFSQGHEGEDYTHLDSNSFLQSPSDSIDYAVMEKTENAGVVPVDMNWNDVGSWQSLWDIGKKDHQQNVVKGQALLESTHGCLVYNQGHSDEKPLVLIGVSDLILVHTDDAMLVCHRNAEQKVKAVSSQLNQKKKGSLHLN